MKTKELPVKTGATLLDINRTSVYYKGMPISQEELDCKSIIDRLHTDNPAWGARQLSAQLKKRGHQVGRRKTRRYMNEMGIDPIYPKMNLSKRMRQAKVCPYLLRNAVIDRPNQALEIKNVAYSYANSKEKVLSGVNQKFELGKFYAIVGKSGTGKSTLLSLLAGLDKPKTGKILFKNEDIQKKGYSNHRKNNISLVFQNYNLIDYLSPIENIRLVNKSADESILFELGLDKKQIKRNVMKLSGGQQQRVAIARALVSDAPIEVEIKGLFDGHNSGGVSAAQGYW